MQTLEKNKTATLENLKETKNLIDAYGEELKRLLNKQDEDKYISVKYLEEIERIFSDYYSYENSNIVDEDIWPFFNYIKKFKAENMMLLSYPGIDASKVKINLILDELEKMMVYDYHKWVGKLYYILEKILENNENNQYITLENDNTEIELD